MFKTWKNRVVIVLLVTFCLLNPNVVFANEYDASNFQQTTDYVQNFEYKENGQNFECFFEKTSNGFDGVIYKLENGEKIFYDQFNVSSDIKGNVWIDGILFAEAAQEDKVMPLELYPYQYHHGEVHYSNAMSSASVALGIYTAIANVNPFISVGVTVFMPIATEVVEAMLPSAYYQVRSQLETFPTDVPPVYQGAVTKIDYKYTLYRTTDLTSVNQIGQPVYDTYYGMPN